MVGEMWDRVMRGWVKDRVGGWGERWDRMGRGGEDV